MTNNACGPENAERFIASPPLFQTCAPFGTQAYRPHIRPVRPATERRDTERDSRERLPCLMPKVVLAAQVYKVTRPLWGGAPRRQAAALVQQMAKLRSDVTSKLATSDMKA